MTYLAIFVLLFCVVLLTWLVSEQGKSIRHIEDLAHRDRIDSRARFLETINNERVEYQALVQSYVISEGKVFVTPVTRYENRRQPNVPDPPVHAFKIKPPPPHIENSPKPRVGQTPSGEGR